MSVDLCMQHTEMILMLKFVIPPLDIILVVFASRKFDVWSMALITKTASNTDEIPDCNLMKTYNFTIMQMASEAA